MVAAMPITVFITLWTLMVILLLPLSGEASGCGFRVYLWSRVTYASWSASGTFRSSAQML